MYENYDVAIIGGGPAAVFAAYEFTLKYPTVSLIMLEEGNPIERRQCPLAAKKVDHCLRCVPCDIMRGFGGAGAFSDGKYNFTTEFGGWLSEYIPEKTVIELIDYVDELNCRHGAPGEYFSTKNSTIGGLALGHDLHLLNAKVRHLGTEITLLLWSIFINIWLSEWRSAVIPMWKLSNGTVTVLNWAFAARIKLIFAVII